MLNRMRSSPSLSCRALGIGLVLVLTGLGCEGEPRGRSASLNKITAKVAVPKQANSGPSAAAVGTMPAEPGPAHQVALGRGVWFRNEGNRRQVLVQTTVCLREGGLECLLCRTHTKEHESILATDADAQVIHAGLLATGAQPGAPVQYVEKHGEVAIVPPTGSRIKISLQYEERGKTVTVLAQHWIHNAKTKKDLEDQWVFAGSSLLPSPNDPKQKPVYAATSDGSYICVYNMPYAMLDLPVNNPNKDPEIRELQPQTDRIPPLQTKVTLILEPQSDEKGKQ